MKPTTNELDLSVLNTPIVIDMDGLRSYLARIPDPRKARGQRYRLVDVLTLLILAKLGGQDQIKGMVEWVKYRAASLIDLLKMPRCSVPHQTTYERILARLDVAVVEQVLGQYLAQRQGQNVCISIDGKTLRGTICSEIPQGVHLLAAYEPQQGVVLLQVEVDGKENEISAAPRLLQQLDLNGCIVTADAMHTQVKLCDDIVTAGGDYLLPVKANQPTLQQHIAEVFVPPIVMPGHSCPPLPIQHHQTITKQSGRIEYRYLSTTDALNDYLDWPHVQQVFRLQRVVRHSNGRLSYQVVFGISSLSVDVAPPPRLMQLIRDHWHIENRLHFVRDVTFHEDACRIRHPKRQHLLATFNNLAIGLIRQCRFDYIPEARRYFALNFEQAYRLFF